MVTLDDLNKILLIQNLPNTMLEQMLPHMHKRSFEEGQIVCDQGQKAHNFYMLARGKVLLEIRIAEGVSIHLGSVKSGFSFGWSALLGDVYSSYALCAEPCEVLWIPGASLLDIFDRDQALGYVVMTRVCGIIKRRLERRTNQFLKMIRMHPDLIKLIGPEPE